MSAAEIQLATDLTRRSLRDAFGCFPSGVTAVCGLVDGVPHGIAASSFTSVSLEPPLVSLCIAHASTTWPGLAQLPRLGVSVLAEGHADIAAALASGRDDRFAAVDWTSSGDGAVFVRGSTLWLDCEVYQAVPAGDHDIILLSVVRLWTDTGVGPLVFHGSSFRQLATASE